MVHFSRRGATRVLIIAAVTVAVVASFSLWFRNSSFVRVTDVTVTGLDGRQGAEIRSVLTAAGEDMTTLNVREYALLSAVAPYPIVRGLRTQTDFPHGLKIIVKAYEPVGALEANGGRVTAIASDGTLLRGTPTRDLPLVGVRSIPGGDRVGDKLTMGAVDLLAAAPRSLRARVVRVYRGKRGEVGGGGAGARAPHLPRRGLRGRPDSGAAGGRWTAAQDGATSTSTLG
jgi:hypothetical protein